MTIQLSFGTAGIRAKLGPGADQINLYTVGGVLQAVCEHLLEQFPGAAAQGLCVGFDGRTQSDLFAREVVRVASENGLRVRAFETPVPTPLLAFCTRLHKAVAGIMITASHNPPADNGIKLYLQGGVQVSAPHEAAIARRIAAFERRDPAVRAASSGSHEVLGEREVEAYLDAIEKLVSSVPLAFPPFAYSALCGVGGAVTRRLFSRLGAHNVHEVEAQAEPRADFGGLSQPNPEHASALSLLLQRATETGVNLAFAHDPDADRLAVIARDRHGALRALSGDEVGALLGDFLLRGEPEPSRALFVSTLVSGQLLEHIASEKGAHFARTPTGFKWIAARARRLEQSDRLRFVLGYEEAIGYAFGSMADDKDGIAALAVMLELARRLHASGETLCTRLDALATAYGVFATRQLTVPRGESGGGLDLMSRLRAVDPEAFFGAGSTRIDYAREPEAVELLVFQRPNGSRLCVRPSGTEPKVKLYLHARAEVKDNQLDEAERAATVELNALESLARTV